MSYAGYFLASLRDLHADRVEPYLSEFGRQYVEAARTQCLSDLVALADGRRPADLVTNPDAPTPTFDADFTALTNYRQDDLPSDVMIGYGTADIDVPPDRHRSVRTNSATAKPWNSRDWVSPQIVEASF